MEIENNDEELNATNSIDIIGNTSPMAYFDEVIGHIEDIIMSEEFQTLHTTFLDSNWQSIENSEENKHEYMEIFRAYTQTFENFLILQLTRRMSNFNMQEFAEMLSQNDCFRDTANYSEVFELLHSFSDFQVFKELMLDYRAKKEGNLQHLGFDILITKPLSCKQFNNGNELDITSHLTAENE